MNRRTRSLIAAIFTIAAMPAAAQWLNVPTKGIPRTKDGKPDRAAPAPKAADGNPDLSGLWHMSSKYTVNIAADLERGDVQPWAAALFVQHAENLRREDPANLQCLPQGPRANLFSTLMEKIVQTPDLIMILIEDLTYRQIFLDGRELPKDPNPSFMGYSVGHWQGDTLVVESNGFKDRTWLDILGHPHSEALHVVERINRFDFGHMEITETIDDPKAFTRPFTIRIDANIVPDSELLEYVCAENERDSIHLVGKASDPRPIPVKVGLDALGKYVGTYEYRNPGDPAVPQLLQITLSNGALFIDGAPLIPLSETVFLLGERSLEFVINDQGAAQITTEVPEGPVTAVRRPDAK